MIDFVRGAGRSRILHHAPDGEVHGAWMAQELARHGYRISPGTLYPNLHRMEADGLPESRATVVSGPTRRVYVATEKGRQAPESARPLVRELAEELIGE